MLKQRWVHILGKQHGEMVSAEVCRRLSWLWMFAQVITLGTMQQLVLLVTFYGCCLVSSYPASV